MLDMFKRLFGKKAEKPKAVVSKNTVASFGTTVATPSGARKGHTGEFVKEVQRRRVRNKIAKMSRKANR